MCIRDRDSANELVTHTALSLMSFGSLDCCLMWSLYWLRHCRRAKGQRWKRDCLESDGRSSRRRKSLNGIRKMRKTKERTHWDTWLKKMCTTIGHIKRNVISFNAPEHMSKATTYVNDILPLLQIGGTVVLDLYHMEQVLVQSTRDRHLQTQKHTSSTDHFTSLQLTVVLLRHLPR